MKSSFLILVLVLCCLASPSVCDPRANEAALICSNTTAAPSDRQVFISNFLASLDTITPLVSTQRYGVVVNGSGNTTVYTFGECMKDLSKSDCNLCFAQCKTQILRCLPFQRLIRGGRLFYDGCYLRYDDYMFFNESLSLVDKSVCGKDDFVGDQSLFRSNVLELVNKLSLKGVGNDGFFVGDVQRGNLSVFGLAQCWEFVKGRDCQRCLADSVSKIRSCIPKDQGRVLNSGCYLRYSTQRFYNNSGDGDAPVRNERGSKLAVILAATFGGAAFLLFIAMITFFVRKKILKQKREKKQLGALLRTVNNSKFNFSYEILEKATNYFHDSNKLGQGGSGIVYRGILPSGPESLLIYEYVPNQSLHDYFSAQKNVHLLSWQVRLFPEDKSHISTAIAGTLGYMAPEYVVRGKLTEKADVYSYGILVIEVICGKRNNAFAENAFSIIQTAWNLYQTGRSCETVDPSLEGNFQEQEASRLLQIGLLCAQASAELRPSMSSVVKMIVGEQEVPQPAQPPFLNSTSSRSTSFNQLQPTHHSRPPSNSQSSGNSMTESIEPR
ncbi:Cysteine-rich receptor-like protein kinase 3 [Heracleum sosnowskyi]|uniref:Cysteine-rich receptor-like protein kinase 3 n=1 Tax=Heracleum sosnowskyi TaxID=360622 RepID=A0AAD8M874_9APIA|nr:Cysteine-rich receptor-like protein kinase 3 [Heracleum sosnowskyi]